MPKIDAEQERTSQLLSQISDLTDSEPAEMIAWYDALTTQDKARFLTGLARWQGQLQIDTYLVLRISHTMMGVLHRDELLARSGNGNT